MTGAMKDLNFLINQRKLSIGQSLFLAFDEGSVITMKLRLDTKTLDSGAT